MIKRRSVIGFPVYSMDPIIPGKLTIPSCRKCGKSFVVTYKVGNGMSQSVARRRVYCESCRLKQHIGNCSFGEE